ncbi:hypothetical protein NLO74_12495 [Pseudomonas tremae]|nr:MULTISPECIES: hypothetical protein [Pseudomonas syringae group]MCF5803808.1 hypothetical protein [Pseudomonas tremae]MCF5810600.1 hypothetical protein [Pseudomonas tremae]MCQ3014331.1 hypothetical protein [Pseudomonas tremae]MCQ3026830.1 hypothetical protein [Pseudomonas tremae]QGL57101.1 hypothetical protein POR16_12465 [Pseudomonas coronafaciens pv. oryzae str. 1_6]
MGTPVLSIHSVSDVELRNSTQCLAMALEGMDTRINVILRADLVLEMELDLVTTAQSDSIAMLIAWSGPVTHMDRTGGIASVERGSCGEEVSSAQI